MFDLYEAGEIQDAEGLYVSAIPGGRKVELHDGTVLVFDQEAATRFAEAMLPLRQASRRVA
jgi:hypothetical protein